jgi:hypothetical protein
VSSGWRGLALILGVIVAICGVFFWNAVGNPMVLILGVLIAITAVLEPIYGRANGKPAGTAWRSTDEKFVDPETGKLVTVWFDPETGERRYVEESEAAPR